MGDAARPQLFVDNYGSGSGCGSGQQMEGGSCEFTAQLGLARKLYLVGPVSNVRGKALNLKDSRRKRRSPGKHMKQHYRECYVHTGVEVIYAVIRK